MKFSCKKINILSLTALFLAACTPTKYDPIKPEDLVGKKIESTTNIKQLKENFLKSKELFSVDPIESKSDLVFNGIVTSTDVEGNIYKYIVVQEEEKEGHAIRISVDEFGLSSIYPLGQRISVIANNLFIGKYGDSPQIGADYYNEKHDRKEPGRLHKIIANKHLFAYGKAEPKAVIADTMTIQEILNADKNRLIHRLVCIKNASFTGKGDRGQLKLAERIFAPGTNGMGYPQAREIKDESGATILISTSEYAKFARKPIPDTNIKGDITAIVGWFKNNTYPGKWQLTLRTLNDLGRGFETYKKEAKAIVVDSENNTNPKNPQEPETMGTIDFTKDKTSPVHSINESFDNIENKKDISIEGWKNIKVKGNRLWQGNIFKDTEKYAQASAHKAKAGDYECWLVTPPVDLSKLTKKTLEFKSAKAYWQDSSSLKVFVLKNENGKTTQTELKSAKIATKSDKNNTFVSSGEIDLSNYKGIIYIGFQYLAKGGESNSTTFRIDDIVVK